MTYYTQALLAHDTELMLRATACASAELIAAPEAWVGERAWELSASPGWDAAYSAAFEAGVENPGRDGTVVTDEMIRAAVLRLKSPAE